MLSLRVDGLIETLGVGYYIIVYAIGIFAMALSVISFQFKKRVSIILCNCFGQISWIVYFVLQGDLVSAIACALSAIMLWVFSKKDQWKWAIGKVSITLFIVLICGFSLLTFRNWMDIFPLLAGAFAVIANSRTSETRLRQFSVFWCLFWFLNSTFKLYPVAFVNDLLCTCSTIVSLIRYRKKATEIVK